MSSDRPKSEDQHAELSKQNGTYAAFPSPTEYRSDGQVISWAVPGLSKRELFAAMAMAHLSTEYVTPGTTFAGKVAEQAVEYADALLKELAK